MKENSKPKSYYTSTDFVSLVQGTLSKNEPFFQIISDQLELKCGLQVKCVIKCNANKMAISLYNERALPSFFNAV